MAATTLTTWEEFLRLPDPPDESVHYELQDGEVVTVPFARPVQAKLQKRIEKLLEAVAGPRGVVTIEFPYRPQPNLQYWKADLAYIPQADWDRLPDDAWPVYTPPIIIEILSPSNTVLKLNRQRMIALSSGAEEFWVVDAEQRTIEVSSVQATRITGDEVTRLHGSRIYGVGDTIRVLGGDLPVNQIFG